MCEPFFAPSLIEVSFPHTFEVTDAKYRQESNCRATNECKKYPSPLLFEFLRTFHVVHLPHAPSPLVHINTSGVQHTAGYLHNRSTFCDWSLSKEGSTSERLLNTPTLTLYYSSTCRTLMLAEQHSHAAASLCLEPNRC